jgi:sugar O-acyltransferase (sialic acid O-acetyltransferase NeuD family)
MRSRLTRLDAERRQAFQCHHLVVCKQRLVIIGGGGHASDVLGVVEAINGAEPTWDVVGLLAEQRPSGCRFARRDIEHLGTISKLAELESPWVVAIGFPSPRRALAAEAASFTAIAPAELIHPLSDVGFAVEVECGAVVLGQSRLSAHSVLGAHSCVGYLASVGHDTHVGAFTSVMPGATVAGDVTLGEAVLVGAGAVVLEGRTIGDEAVIGAGAVVTTDVSPGITVVGVPARPVSS